MKWETIRCVLVLLHFARGQVDDNEFHSETECCRQAGISEGQCNWSTTEGCMQASWEMVNTTNGRFRMTFDFPSVNDCSEFVAKLDLIEAITSKTQCEINTTFSNASKHTSGKTLMVHDCDENCTKMCSTTKAREFYFQFIFTGCYQLEIKLGRYGSAIDFCPTFLESEYRKQLLVDSEGPSGVEQDGSAKFPAIIRINMNEHPWKEMWLVQTMLVFEFLNKNNSETKNRWDVWLQPDKRVSCNGTESQLPECELDSSNSLELRLPNVEPGEYVYTVALSGDTDNRCQLDSLWLTLCEWKFDQTVTNQSRSKKTSPSPPEDSNLHVYGSILAVVFLVLIFTLVAIRCAMKKKPPTVPVQAPITVSILGQRTAILLLYSRDCEAFMKLMASFRRFLEQATEFEIYDCHDPKRWAEISLDPSSWMQRLTTHADTRVIAVASRCASIRQRAHIDGAVIHFATPCNTDKMFPYALRLLTDEMARTASYQRTFVVRFDGFSDDDDLYQVLNTYTRFVLPLHLDKLICSLKQCTVDEITESWFNMEDGKILQDDLNNLVRYKSQNPEYLQNLLVKERTRYEPEMPLSIYT